MHCAFSCPSAIFPSSSTLLHDYRARDSAARWSGTRFRCVSQEKPAMARTLKAVGRHRRQRSRARWGEGEFPRRRTSSELDAGSGGRGGQHPSLPCGSSCPLLPDAFSATVDLDNAVCCDGIDSLAVRRHRAARLRLWLRCLGVRYQLPPAHRARAHARRVDTPCARTGSAGPCHVSQYCASGSSRP